MNDVVPPEALPAVRSKSIPGILQSIALAAVFYSVVVGVSLPLELWKLTAGISLDAFWSLLIAQLIAWPITIWAGLRWASVPFRQACPLGPFPVRLLPALLVANFGMTILLLSAAGLIPMPEAFRQILSQQMAESSRWSLFLAVVVVAPLAEELFFRGLVLRGYLGRYSVTAAVWTSALLFAVFHLNPWQGVIALPVGVLYAWLFLRTGSLLPGIVGHATVNFSANFLMTPLALALGYSAEELEATNIFPVPMLAIGAVATAIGLFVLWRQLPGDTRSPMATQPESLPPPALP